jgi:hypothetical protein
MYTIHRSRSRKNRMRFLQKMNNLTREERNHLRKVTALALPYLQELHLSLRFGYGAEMVSCSKGLLRVNIFLALNHKPEQICNSIQKANMLEAVKMKFINNTADHKSLNNLFTDFHLNELPYI